MRSGRASPPPDARVRRSWSGALVALAFVAVLFAACRTKRPGIVYRLDPEARGWIVIVFSRPEAPPLPMRGDAFVIDVPASGVVSTSTKPPVGSAPDTLLINDGDGRERPLPFDSVRAHHLGRAQWQGGEWLDYETFFVGTKAEMEAAETEDQALARVRALLPTR